MGQAVELKEVVDFLKKEKFDFKLVGKTDGIFLQGFSSLANYKAGTITWVKSEKNWNDTNEKVLVCVVQEKVNIPCSIQIVSNDSKAVFFAILEHFFGGDTDEKRIGEYTYIGDNVKLGKNVRIGNNCSITGDVTIGDDTIISDNVVIRNKVTIGKRCQIQALTVIGEEGFGFYENTLHKKVMVKHYGGVNIGNDVFVGSHVNIARGTIDDTYIGNGVKIAPSTHIGHNNQVGENAVVICSQLYGSVQLGENAYIVGSIVRNQCKIGQDTMIGMGSVVTKDIEERKVAIGAPAKIIRNNN